MKPAGNGSGVDAMGVGCEDVPRFMGDSSDVPLGST
jgi:hypothetical protein